LGDSFFPTAVDTCTRSGCRSHTATPTVSVTALRVVIGHSESERRGADRFECVGVQFHLVAAAGATTITIAGYGQGDRWLKTSYPSNIRAGHELIDRLADAPWTVR
jgi:hypothetical protein